MLQRITYFNKAGERISVIAKIIVKRSKTIVIRLPDDEINREIPRNAVESIEIPEKLITT